jgi:hypothetical protein
MKVVFREEALADLDEIARSSPDTTLLPRIASSRASIGRSTGLLPSCH